MLLQSLGHFKGLLYPENGVVIDDAAFRLHYGFTSYLLVTKLYHFPNAFKFPDKFSFLSFSARSW